MGCLSWILKQKPLCTSLSCHLHHDVYYIISQDWSFPLLQTVTLGNNDWTLTLLVEGMPVCNSVSDSAHDCGRLTLDSSVNSHLSVAIGFAT